MKLPNILPQDFHIIESTLREGEQFADAYFTSDDKRAIAEMLDDFGVEYLELTTPLASPKSKNDLKMIAKLQRRVDSMI